MTDTRFYQSQGPMALSKICTSLGLTATNKSGDPEIQGVSTLIKAGTGDVSFFNNKKHAHELDNCKAAALIVDLKFEAIVKDRPNVILTESPQKTLAQVIHLFYPQPDNFGAYPLGPGVSKQAKLGQGVQVCAGAVVSDGAEIGGQAVIGPNCFIGPGVKIGAHCHIHANTTITHSIIGDKVIIYPGAVIGRAGFGFAMEKTGPVDVPQIGRVIIEDNVHIGANTTVDRGALDDTIIGEGTRIDNLVQIAHNVKIGKGCIIVAQVGISGSTQIGDFCAFGGQAGLTGHLKIGKGVQIAAQSGVVRDIEDGQIMGGTPAMPVMQWKKSSIVLAKLGQKKKD